MCHMRKDIEHTEYLFFKIRINSAIYGILRPYTSMHTMQLRSLHHIGHVHLKFSASPAEEGVNHTGSIEMNIYGRIHMGPIGSHCKGWAEIKKTGKKGSNS
jgi:hypothetical protein